MTARPPSTLERSSAAAARLHALGQIGRAATCIAGGLAFLAGCIRLPDGAAPMCESTSDCDRAHGEVCEEGVCWGNPPPGPFAAVVSPPSTRHDLVSREIPQVDIPDFGWFGDLALDAPVLFNGKIVSSCTPPLICDPTPLPGTVTVSRPSRFHGGPGFTAAANVDAGDSFAIPVPRTQAGDVPYTVTIVPESSQMPGLRSAAELVPPRRLQLAISDNTSIQVVELGGADLPTISGTLVDSVGRPRVDYRVVALGRWAPDEPPTEVSTVAFSDGSGAYSLTLSDQLVGTVDLVARPTSRTPDVPPPTAPTVRVANLDATRSSVVDVREPSNLGNPVQLTLKVEGLDPGGAIAAVNGAVVSITGMVVDAAKQTTFTMSDEQVANSLGVVTMHLLDGSELASGYRMSITPPAGSTFAVMFDQKVSLAPQPPVRLGSRVELRGRVVDSDGAPITSAAVTARPSLRFLWTLEPAPQAFVAVIPAATAVTYDNGEFVLWVDPSIAQVPARYDLLVEPPTGARAPAYVRSEIEIQGFSALDAFNVSDITVPEAAFIHGRITGPGGNAVADAELKLYLVSTADTLCNEVVHPPQSCLVPAQLRGRNTSDSDGIVRLILPR